MTRRFGKLRLIMTRTNIDKTRLNLMFTVAAVSTNVSALPVGTVLDRYGPRICSLIGCVFITIGCLLLAFADQIRPGDGYIPGYLFLALGGPFIYISTFQLSNTFPQYSGLILALVTGAFDTSSAIFLFYRLVYQASDGSARPKTFFLAYLVVPVLIGILQFAVMPSNSYKTISELVRHAEEDTDIADSTGQSPAERQHRESVITEITSLLGDKKADRVGNIKDEIDPEEKKRAISGVWGALHGRSARQQIGSWWFALVAAFTIIQMLRINYFVATIRPQYTYLLGSVEAAKDVNAFFDVALPLGGVIAIPFIGLVLDNTSTSFVLGLLVVIASTIGILGILPYQWAAYANIVLFVLYRPLYYTTVSDYAAKVFGFVTFGKVYGLIICLAGLFNFLQTPLDAATHGRFKNNPIPVNVILEAVAAAVGIALVSYVWAKSRSIHREKLEEEAEASVGGAGDHPVPGHDERVHEDHHPVDVHRNDPGYGAVDREPSASGPSGVR